LRVRFSSEAGRDWWRCLLRWRAVRFRWQVVHRGRVRRGRVEGLGDFVKTRPGGRIGAQQGVDDLVQRTAAGQVRRILVGDGSERRLRVTAIVEGTLAA